MTFVIEFTTGLAVWESLTHSAPVRTVWQTARNGAGGGRQAGVTFIDAVAVYLPDHRVSVADLADHLGLSAMQVRLFCKFLGFAEVSRDRVGTLADLLNGAAAELKALRGREHLVATAGPGATFAAMVFEH